MFDYADRHSKFPVNFSKWVNEDHTKPTIIQFQVFFKTHLSVKFFLKILTKLFRHVQREKLFFLSNDFNHYRKIKLFYRSLKEVS